MQNFIVNIVTGLLSLCLIGLSFIPTFLSGANHRFLFWSCG